MSSALIAIVAIGLAAPALSLTGTPITNGLTLHDYGSLKGNTASYPMCQVSYADLDVSRIMAYCYNDGSECGQCRKVCGSAGCANLLVVDRCDDTGPGHHDISQLAGPQVVGSDTGRYDASQVTSDVVDASNCLGIWNGKFYLDQEIQYAPLQALQALIKGGAGGPATGAQTGATTTAAAPTTTAVPTTTAIPTTTTVPPPLPTTSSTTSSSSSSTYIPPVQPSQQTQQTQQTQQQPTTSAYTPPIPTTPSTTSTPTTTTQPPPEVTQDPVMVTDLVIETTTEIQYTTVEVDVYKRKIMKGFMFAEGNQTTMVTIPTSILPPSNTTTNSTGTPSVTGTPKPTTTGSSASKVGFVPSVVMALGGVAVVFMAL